MAILTDTQLKNYLGIVGTDYDDKIALIIAGVDSFIESYTGREFESAARDEYIDGGGEFLPVSFAPVTAIASITDEENSSALIPAADYDYRPATGMIYLSAPVTTLGFTNNEGRLEWGKGRRRYRVQYTGGTATAPADVTLAALQMAAGRFNRPDPGIAGEKDGDYSYRVDTGAFDVSGLPPGTAAILDKHRFDCPI